MADEDRTAANISDREHAPRLLRVENPGRRAIRLHVPSQINNDLRAITQVIENSEHKPRCAGDHTNQGGDHRENGLFPPLAVCLDEIGAAP